MSGRRGRSGGSARDLKSSPPAVTAEDYERVRALLSPEDLRNFDRDVLVHGSAATHITRDAQGHIVSARYVDIQRVDIQPSEQRSSTSTVEGIIVFLVWMLFALLPLWVSVVMAAWRAWRGRKPPEHLKVKWGRHGEHTRCFCCKCLGQHPGGVRYQRDEYLMQLAMLTMAVQAFLRGEVSQRCSANEPRAPREPMRREGDG